MIDRPRIMGIVTLSIYCPCLKDNRFVEQLETGIISIVDKNASSDDKKNTDVLGLNIPKYYDVCLKFDLIKGMVTSENVYDIKCSYKNNTLISMYDKLRQGIDKKNPILLYIQPHVLDIEMLKKTNTINNKNTTNKRKPTGNKNNRSTVRKTGGFVPHSKKGKKLPKKKKHDTKSPSKSPSNSPSNSPSVSI
jgi:hypothetical protein